MAMYLTMRVIHTLSAFPSFILSLSLFVVAVMQLIVKSFACCLCLLLRSVYSVSTFENIYDRFRSTSIPFDPIPPFIDPNVNYDNAPGSDNQFVQGSSHGITGDSGDYSFDNDDNTQSHLQYVYIFRYTSLVYKILTGSDAPPSFAWYGTGSEWPDGERSPLVIISILLIM